MQLALTILRFAEVEGISVLTLFSLRYKIEVKEESQYAHETFEERKSRVLAADSFLTLTYAIMLLLTRGKATNLPIHRPRNVSLVFKRRD